MKSKTEHRKPEAFSIDLATPETPVPEITDLATTSEGSVPVMSPRPRRRSGLPWGGLFFAAAGTLATLAIGLAVTNLISALFAAEGWLGWLSLALAGVAAIAFGAIVLRELAGIAAIGRIRRIRESADAPIQTDSGARRVVAAIVRLYSARPEMASARAELARQADEVIDPQDRLLIAERACMPALDAEARRIIGDTVKRVSIVTAVSPSATIDLGFVFLSHLALIRRLAELYGGRPGLLGLLKLARMVVAHLVVTGGIAIGDDLIEQIVGHGLAARISTRLGEGVLNGLLAARIGVAALELTRPLPFRALKRPRIGDFIAAARAAGTRRERGSQHARPE